MYPSANGFGLPSSIDYPQCFSAGLPSRFSGFGYGPPGLSSSPGDASTNLFDDRAVSASKMCSGMSAGDRGFRSASQCGPWPGAGFSQSGMWLADSAGYGRDFRSVSSRCRTASDDLRVHPYGHRLNEFAAWRELHNATTGYNIRNNFGPTKFEPVIKEEAIESLQTTTTTSSSTTSAVTVANTATIPPVPEMTLGEKFLAMELRLCDVLRQIQFHPPITHIYNPLEYAMVPHRQFVMTYCTGPKDVLFLGINPGPFGMAQTGVPFGEVASVKNWLRISGVVYKPNPEHPKRPVWGFDCTRSEVSGARFWKLLQQLCGTPETFFRRCFVHNMCPLLFMAMNGKNLTPPDLPAEPRRQLNTACDRALADTVRLLRVRTIVAIGKYTQSRARAALRDSGITDVDVIVIMHPSPASPAANKAWTEIALGQMTQAGLLEYMH